MLAIRGFRALALVLAFVLAIAGVVFGVALKATAAGGVSGIVTDQSLVGIDGLTVHLYRFTAAAPGFEEVLPTTTTAGGGFYSFTPADDDLYIVNVDGGSDWTDGDALPVPYDPATSGSGDVDPIELFPAYTISGIVLGNGTPIADALVEVFDSLGTFINDNTSSATTVFPLLLLHAFGTEADGLYTVKVPATTDDYYITANGGPGWHEQGYGVPTNVDDPCGCFTGMTAVSVIGPVTTGIDFDLTGYDPTFDLYAEQDDGTGTSTFDPIVGLTIVFEQLIGPTWTEVHRDVTDASGTLLYQAPLSGDFRIRFESGSAKVAYLDSLQYPRYLYDSTGGCYAQYPGIGPGSYIAVDFGFQASYVSCDPVTPVITPPTGPHKPRTTAFAVVNLVAPTATPTPTPTPTSTPSPSSSPSTSPSPSPTPTTPPIQKAFDITSLWWVLLLLIIGIVILITVLIRRR